MTRCNLLVIMTIGGAAGLLGVAPAAAQFTTAIPPRPKAEVKTVAMQKGDSAHRDTTVIQRLSSMKTWVDSAAVALSVTTPATTPRSERVATRDSTARDTTTAPAAVTQQAAAGEVTRFREGAPAPNTATLLPALALLGVGTLLAGAWLLRR